MTGNKRILISVIIVFLMLVTLAVGIIMLEKTNTTCKIQYKGLKILESSTNTIWQDEYEYELNEEAGTIILNKYIGDRTELVVPEKAVIGGKEYITELRNSISFESIWDSNMEKLGFETGIKLPSDCSFMFYNCSNLVELDISKFDTSNVANMLNMFSNCTKITQLDVSKFDTSKVTNMSGMFLGCTNLQNLDVTKFDTSNVTNMGAMFLNCSNLEELDVSKFDTSNIIYMNDVFSGCSKLTTVDIKNFDTSKVKFMEYMFHNCSSLQGLDLSNFDTNNVTNMSAMFSGCSKLEELDLSTFDLTKVQTTDKNLMFKKCDSLKIIKAPLNIPNGVIHPLNGKYEILNEAEEVIRNNYNSSTRTYRNRHFKKDR